MHDFFNRHRYILLNWDLHFDISVDGVGDWLLYDVFHRILQTQNCKDIKNKKLHEKMR